MKIWVIRLRDTDGNYQMANTFSTERKYRNAFKQLVRECISEAKKEAKDEICQYMGIPLSAHEITYTTYTDKRVHIYIEGYKTELDDVGDRFVTWG